jgi:predicted nucleic acid-binding protein
MTGYVVDASVAVKWLVTEALSDEAARLPDMELTLIAPELLFAEATNALWAMQARRYHESGFRRGGERAERGADRGPRSDATARRFRGAPGDRSRSSGL